jgi:hypothetical protein
MALYIANLSKFEFQLHFWVEGVNKPVIERIGPGKQKSIYPQGNQVDHHHIVDQHKIYGLIPASEVARHPGFVGQCYQFDTPIAHDLLYTTMLKNEDMLNDQALERRKEMAFASDDLMRRTAQDTDTKLNAFEVEIEEVEQKGVDPQIHERISVGEDAHEPRRRPGRPRKN